MISIEKCFSLSTRLKLHSTPTRRFIAASMQLTTTQTEEEWNDPPHLLLLSLCCSTWTLRDNIWYYIIWTLSLTFELESLPSTVPPWRLWACKQWGFLSHCFLFMSNFIHILCKWILHVASCIQSSRPGGLHQSEVSSEPELKAAAAHSTPSSQVDPHTRACGGSVGGWWAGRATSSMFRKLFRRMRRMKEEPGRRALTLQQADSLRSNTAATFTQKYIHISSATLYSSTVFFLHPPVLV